MCYPGRGGQTSRSAFFGHFALPPHRGLRAPEVVYEFPPDLAVCVSVGILQPVQTVPLWSPKGFQLSMIGIDAPTERAHLPRGRSRRTSRVGHHQPPDLAERGPYSPGRHEVWARPPRPHRAVGVPR